MVKTNKTSSDPNKTAHGVLDEVLRRDQVADALQNDELRREVMREMGRMGGKAGGPARKAALTPERRSEIARNAVAAREAKRKKK